MNDLFKLCFCHFKGGNFHRFTYTVYGAIYV